MSPTNNNLHIENEHTFLEALKTGIGLYLGAGFSVLAKNESGQSFPVGDALRVELIQEFKAQAYSELDLPQLASVLSATRKEEFETFLRTRFKVGKLDDKYLALRKLNVKSIFTVNIDNVIPTLFTQVSPFFLQDITRDGPAKSDEAISYVPLHGCILNPNQTLTFSSVDIASSSTFDADRWRALSEMLQRTPMLFWGTKIVDGGVLTALNSRAIDGRAHQPKWIVLLEKNTALETYYKSLGFAILIANTEALLNYFEQNVKTPDPAIELFTNRDVRTVFPENSIPAPFSVPVRPSAEFFGGSEPTWHDIFSGQIPKTSHFDRVLDMANSRQHAVVIGIPFSGKTTLMMQVAHELKGTRYKLLFDAVSPERAESVVSRLSGDEAIIFIDNFTDSLDGFLQLAREPNIQVIGFDRDLNYEMVSHLITRKTFGVIDVTNLQEADLQAIFAKLPADSRKDNLSRRATTESGLPPSIFEFIEFNLKYSNLRQRIPRLLSALKESREDLFDLFLMISYVTECRTPVSLDMFWAYLGGTLPNYKAIISRVKTLGSMIAELSNDAAIDLGLSEDQDYYQLRSRIFSSSVLRATSNIDLRIMLDRFHSEVSPFRIVRFDVFKKSAFQAKLITRAFPNADEGKAFYENAYKRQPNYYLLQQGAIYLSTMGRFKEAFRWIDQAIRDTNGRILSIRNTHAMILFRANIKASGDEATIRSTLTESMDILQKLYRQDDRKNHHVGTFARQALDFYDRYRDDLSLSYLKTAKEWLEREVSASPWNGFLKKDLGRIKSVVSRECS